MLKVDDQFPTHTKVLGLSHRAFRLHVTALCYCAANLTDGLITREALPIVGAISGRGKALTDELERAKLWVPNAAGWTIHGYLDWNPSKDHVQEKRRVGKENAERRWRGAVPNANGIGDGSPIPNASPAFALPLPKGALAPSPAVDVGHDAHASKIAQIAFACRAMQGENYEKIVRAARGCAEGDLVAALEACGGPGVVDRLAVALSTLKKRRNAA